MRKINYLDGLRGAASLMVAIHHFLLAFYPAAFSGISTETHIGDGKQEIYYSQSVISILTNGNFAVYIFFVLSGFVLSRKYFVKNLSEILVESAVKRYMRLFIPVFATVVISYVFIKLHFYCNAQAAIISKSGWWLGRFWAFDPTFMYALTTAFVGVFFYGSGAFSNTLWTMSAELYGSMLVFSLLALTHNMRKRWLAYLLLALIFFKLGNFYNVAFIAGVVLSHYFENIVNWGKSKASTLPIILLFAVGIFAGGYISKADVSGSIYSVFSNYKILNSFDFFHMVGAVALLTAILVSPFIHRILGFKPFVFLGDISFSLYLIHPIILGSFSSWLLLKLQGLGYNHCMLIIFPLTLAVFFVASHLMTITVDRFSIQFPGKVYRRFFQPNAVGVD